MSYTNQYPPPYLFYNSDKIIAFCARITLPLMVSGLSFDMYLVLKYHQTTIEKQNKTTTRTPKTIHKQHVADDGDTDAKWNETKQKRKRDHCLELKWFEFDTSKCIRPTFLSLCRWLDISISAEQKASRETAPKIDEHCQAPRKGYCGFLNVAAIGSCQS